MTYTDPWESIHESSDDLFDVPDIFMLDTDEGSVLVYGAEATVTQVLSYCQQQVDYNAREEARYRDALAALEVVKNPRSSPREMADAWTLIVELQDGSDWPESHKPTTPAQTAPAPKGTDRD